jgi:hypothetical protein
MSLNKTVEINTPVQIEIKEHFLCIWWNNVLMNMMHRFIVEYFVPSPGALIGAMFCANKKEYDNVSKKIT